MRLKLNKKKRLKTRTVINVLVFKTTKTKGECERQTAGCFSGEVYFSDQQDHTLQLQ